MKIFKQSDINKNVKRGSFGFFKHPFCCKISKKTEGGPFEVMKKLSTEKQKMILLKYFSAKNAKMEPFWFF